ncbi:hypothetical protein G6O67_002760 [Ophiocordyceps sinensis]|uniref:Uncharacterized protein n=1 Tax=Ophiocordyceps sinensis TaxID=72228 RepID=A0A8H4PUZ7_9HYPO|nr:hypothetical protein G6O67_002760 [Ophiocordyceps sinensis]
MLELHHRALYNTIKHDNNTTNMPPPICGLLLTPEHRERNRDQAARTPQPDTQAATPKGKRKAAEREEIHRLWSAHVVGGKTLTQSRESETEALESKGVEMGSYALSKEDRIETTSGVSQRMPGAASSHGAEW